MKKLLIIATLSIAVAAVIKRVTDKHTQFVVPKCRSNKDVILDLKKLSDHYSSSKRSFS